MRPLYMGEPALASDTSSGSYRAPDVPTNDAESQFMQEQWEDLTPLQQAAVAKYETDQALSQPMIQLAMFAVGGITAMAGAEYVHTRAGKKDIEPISAAALAGGGVAGVLGYCLASYAGRSFYMRMFWRSKYPQAGK